MKAFGKDIRRTIASSKKRFFSIALICALGVTMSVGLSVACLDLRRSANEFFTEQGLHDVAVMSTLGLTDEDVQALEELDSVAVAVGSYEQAVRTEIDDHQESASVKALSDAGMDEPCVVQGRLPQSADEIAVTQAYLNDTDKQILDTVTFEPDVEDADDASGDADASEDDPQGSGVIIDGGTFTIVGVVVDPTNMISPEGPTAFRNSTSSDYTFYVTDDNVQGDTYSSVYLRLAATEGLSCYSGEYEQAVETAQDEIAGIQQQREQARTDEVRDDALGQIDEQQQEAEAQIADAQAQIDDAQAQIDQGAQAAAESRAALDEQALYYDSLPVEAQQQIDAGYAQLAQTDAQLQESQAQLDEQRAELEEQSADAQQQIQDARDEADAIEPAQWYVQDRSSMGGYASIDSDAGSIETIAAVFPAIFLIVAVLVSLTTAMRMVEEQRGLIGIYKALGYSKPRIMWKYVSYTLLACLLGCVLGNLLGFFALPAFLFGIFDTMYLLPNLSFHFDAAYALGSSALFLVFIVGAVAIACNRDLRQTPAQLMRPKAPRAGKRILLEHTGPLWRHMSFLGKVTARNLFRYKARFLMTVFGILGCTMLLVCGFAIKNTVDSLPERQYGEVSQYDLLAVTSADDLPAAHEDLASDELVTAIQDVYVDNVTVQSGPEKLTLQLFVIPDGESLDGMVSLTTKDGGQKVRLADEGMLLGASAAQVLGVEDADGVQVRTSSLAEGDVTIAHVVAGYLGDAAYMSQAAYESVFGSVEPNAMLATLAGNATRQIDFADVLARDDTYLSVTSTEKLRLDFSSAFTLINGVVYVVIVLAAGLAFIVLFTLSTTNISERQRELATLKVLGFRQKEVRHYVNRETILLTVIGIALGLPAGLLLSNSFSVLLKLPGIYFATYVNPWTYVIATVITLVFALAVSRVTNRMLDDINMVEALKSPE